MAGQTVPGLFFDQEIDEGEAFWFVVCLCQELAIPIVVIRCVRSTHRYPRNNSCNGSVALRRLRRNQIGKSNDGCV
jgi:hypothetical protein